MQVALLHHLGVPCVATVRVQNPKLYEGSEVLHLNPEALVRYEPGGAVVIPPMLYASFLHVDEDVAALFGQRNFVGRGLPQDVVSLLLENKVLLRESPVEGTFREMYVQASGLPTQVLFEVTSACNCDCLACYHKADLDSHSPSLSDLKRRVDQLEQLGLGLFEVTGGEPLLRSDLAEVLEYIVGKGLHFYVVTNGEYLAEMSRELVEMLRRGVGLAVSLDGVGEVHDRIRQRPGLYDRLIAGLDFLQGKGIEVYFIATVHEGNVRNFPQMVAVAKRYGTTLHLRPAIRTGGAVESGLQNVDLPRELQPYLGNPHVRNGLLNTKKTIPSARYFGCGTRKRISISSRGTLFPCVMDRSRPLEQLEAYDQGGLVLALREETKNFLGDHDQCRSCEINEREIVCGGFCRFSRSYERGKLMAKRKSQQRGCYGVLAQFYDRLMSGRKYEVWEALIAEVVGKYAIPRGLCLDVACGTGKISEIVARLGFDVLGIDGSGAMLEVAREKLPNARFIVADVRNFDIGSDKDRVALAVSFYDSLNNLLTDEDMSAAIQSVSRNLSPGAVFLFDMNTREHVLASQHSKSRTFEDEACKTVFRFGGEGRLWTIDMEFDVKRPDGSVERETERHVERGYDEGDITPMLEAAGFDLLEVRRENKVYEDGEERLSRLYFVARKRG